MILFSLLTLCRYTSINKGWGTGILHLGGRMILFTLLTLCRYTSTDKGWGTSVLHLGGLLEMHG